MMYVYLLLCCYQFKFCLLQDYPDFVREPMDFSTIEKKLSEASYVGPQEFVSDFRLVFSNSRLYNRRGSEVGFKQK